MRFISGFLLTIFFTSLLIVFSASDSSSTTYSYPPLIPCPKENITKSFSGNSTSPSISADGTLVVFESQTEITEDNPGGTYQIFLYDAKTGDISQLTDYKDSGSVAPSISGDGSTVAFVSGANIKGNNQDALNLVYLLDIESGEITQVTTSGQSFEPSVNDDGSEVAFTSNLNSENGASSIFIYDSLSGTLAEIDGSTEELQTNPVISSSGKFIAYVSSPILTSPDAGKRSQIYLYDVVSGESKPIGIDGSEVNNLSPSISSDGSLIAFQSDSNTEGENPHKNYNIYLYGAIGEMTLKITNEPGAGSAGPSIDSGGSAIAFQSSGDFINMNLDGNLEIFLYGTHIEKFFQLTDTGSNIQNTGAVISAVGTNMVFVRNDSSLDTNPEQKSDIYLVSCSKDRSIPASSSGALNWVIMAAAFVLIFFLVSKYWRKKRA